MDINILSKIYENDIYLEYLRYHPKWYIILNQNPKAYSDFEKVVKNALQL